MRRSRRERLDCLARRKHRLCCCGDVSYPLRFEMGLLATATHAGPVAIFQLSLGR